MTRSPMPPLSGLALLGAVAVAPACWHVAALGPDGGAGGDAGADTDTDEDVDTDAGPDSGPELPTDCTGLDDFTLCSVVTSPDYSYDICIDGVCESPGCGALECNPPGPHFPLPDTNQRSCSDWQMWTTCPSDGEDYFGQDAQYGWDTTHDASERFSVDVSTTPIYPMVTDNVTGLVWQGCAAGLVGEDCDYGVAAKDTLAEALAYCDGLEWGGRDDWRLPDIYELESTADLGTIMPAVDVAAFPPITVSVIVSIPFWSSSATSGGFGWFVAFDTGSVQVGQASSSFYVRCVRGAPTPRPVRFTRVLTAPGAPVVADAVTGLVWQGCAAGLDGDACENGAVGAFTWPEALAYCEGSTWAGYADWRLPSKEELHSSVDHRLEAPRIDTTAFPATPAGWFWSSSTYVDVTTSAVAQAWAQDLSSGWQMGSDKDIAIDVRCVRGGV